VTLLPPLSREAQSGVCGVLPIAGWLVPAIAGWLVPAVDSVAGGRTGVTRRRFLFASVITLDGQGMHLRPVAIRYSWPGELDLMADRAGLRLAERHAGWDRRPFTSASTSHVSVYQRA